MPRTKLTRLHGWLTPNCSYIEIIMSHIETFYDKELAEKGILPPRNENLSWEKDFDGMVYKHNWIKLNAEIYGIFYSKKLITKEQIEWLCRHRDIMTKEQKECLKEINRLKGR